jgi:hypothetical protein
MPFVKVMQLRVIDHHLCYDFIVWEYFLSTPGLFSLTVAKGLSSYGKHLAERLYTRKGCEYEVMN